MTKNEKQAHNAVIKKQLEYEKAIQKIYIKQLNEIRVLMSQVYEKYAEDGILTHAEMSKYNRLQTLEKQLVQLAGDAANEATKLINKLGPDIYQESFYRRAWALDVDNQVRLSYGTVSVGAVRDTLENDYKKISLTKYGQNARINVRSALQKGLIQGQSYQDMAKDLKTYINTTAFNALRIARTEGNTAQNAGANDVYDLAEKQGIKGAQVWVATLDDKTRDTHQAMDGERVQDDGLFDGPGGARAPYPGWEGLDAEERINCRCSTRYEVDGYSPALRRTRDDGVIPYQTYSEWYANRRK